MQLDIELELSSCGSWQPLKKVHNPPHHKYPQIEQQPGEKRKVRGSTLNPALT